MWRGFRKKGKAGESKVAGTLAHAGSPSLPPVTHPKPPLPRTHIPQHRVGFINQFKLCQRVLCAARGACHIGVVQLGLLPKSALDVIQGGAGANAQRGIIVWGARAWEGGQPARKALRAGGGARARAGRGKEASEHVGLMGGGAERGEGE